MEDYYKKLNITTQASLLEIKKSYRKLALQWHPDHNKRSDAHEIFISINQAYLILSDNEARFKYDIEYNRYFAVKHNDNEFVNFADNDLNSWSNNAKKQAESYARMTYSDFYKLISTITKEVGFRWLIGITYAVSATLSTYAIFLFIDGLRWSNGLNIFVSIILFLFAILGILISNKYF